MFAGSARIDLQIVTATDTLVLNAADLSFGAVQLLDAAGKPAATPKVAVDATAQTASFALGHTIAPGRYTLTADYRGKVYLQRRACSRSTTTARMAASARSTRSSRIATRDASSPPSTSPPTRRPSRFMRSCRPAR